MCGKEINWLEYEGSMEERVSKGEAEEGGNNEESEQAGDLGQRGWGRERDFGNKGEVGLLLESY